MKYNKNIIGRKKEQDILQASLDSKKAEFIAVYGRRRIGKTFLVKQFFKDNFDFYVSGIYGVDRKTLLDRFMKRIPTFSGKKPKNWFDAFDALKDYLQTLKKQKIVIFIDELPWFDTPKSNFIRALEEFWNTWASDRENLKLIVCGSATTWMTNKLLGDKGGLHNRVTRRIRLKPFTLYETRLYLKSQDIGWDDLEILQCHMAIGGVPFYLSMLSPEMSLAQNIDSLFFSEDEGLRSEYEFLFRSLFKNAKGYTRVIEYLATKMKGMTRKEIVRGLRITDNGKLTEILENLCKCDFLRKYSSFGKNNRELLYQLTDPYTLFYLRFVKGYNGKNGQAWSGMKDQKRSNWYGYAFEQVCFQHINQIRFKLGISGIASDVCSWQYIPKTQDEKGVQIDMLINRADGEINLCEMKYSSDEFEMTAEEMKRLNNRASTFKKSM